MQVKFWGVRGSLPSAAGVEKNLEHIEMVLKNFLRTGARSEADVSAFVKNTPLPEIVGYGQNTTCVEVKSGRNQLIIDGGSGIKTYNDYLSQHNRDQKVHHILMTHFHYDHIMGLTFFTPHFLADHEVHYYAVQSNYSGHIQDLFKKPLFPVEYQHLKAKIHFHEIMPYKSQVINGLKVTPFQLDHPDECYGFRIENNGKVYAHAVDHESDRIAPNELGQDVGLFLDADLLYFDAQYLESEMSDKRGWGHGTFHRAFEVCSHYRVKQVVLAHHDPSYGTKDIQKLAEAGQNYFQEIARSKNIEKLKWCFSYDGQFVQL